MAVLPAVKQSLIWAFALGPPCPLMTRLGNPRFIKSWLIRGRVYNRHRGFNTAGLSPFAGLLAAPTDSILRDANRHTTRKSGQQGDPREMFSWQRLGVMEREGRSAERQIDSRFGPRERGQTVVAAR